MRGKSRLSHRCGSAGSRREYCPSRRPMQLLSPIASACLACITVMLRITIRCNGYRCWSSPSCMMVVLVIRMHRAIRWSTGSRRSTDSSSHHILGHLVVRWCAISGCRRCTVAHITIPFVATSSMLFQILVELTLPPLHPTDFLLEQ